MKHYNKRVWLNSENKPSTGSLVCYYGKPHWGGKGVDMFLELSDCHHSVRIHIAGSDEKKDYKNKIRKLEKEIRKYRKFLDKL